MAPKRQRSPPPPSGRLPKRRAQDPVEEFQQPIEPRKNPPRQRLEGLGPPPSGVPRSRKTLSKKPLAPPPPPSRKNHAPPSPASSSSPTGSSEDDGDDHNEEDILQQPQQQRQVEEPQQQEYARVAVSHKGKATKYKPLIPTTLDPLSFDPTKKKALTAFGASFATAEQAATAADRALIAMWGLIAAAPLLHFSQPDYYKLEDRQQRFGPKLSLFLNNMCEDAEALRIQARNEKSRIRERGHQSENIQRRKRVRRIRDAKLIDETKECGLCSSCRQPWFGIPCERKQIARRIGYNSLKIGEKMLENGVEDEEIEEDGEEKEEEELAGAGTSASAHRVSAAAAAAGKRREPMKKELIWLADPPKGKTVATVRMRYTQHVESSHLHSEALAAGEAAAEATALAAALEASRIPGLATAFPPKDFIMEPPQTALLRHAADCAAAGAEVSLLKEDDPRFARPVHPRGAFQCTLCYGWHSVANSKDCPLLQAAYAVEPPQKEPCRNCGGVLGCSHCGRAQLPAAMWAPSEVPCSWVNKVKPATLDVMHSVQNMASAAAVDFDRPDVAGKLGPDALLALGLLAEEVAAAQVVANTSTTL